MISLLFRLFSLLLVSASFAFAASDGDHSYRSEASAFRSCNRYFYDQAGMWLEGLAERKGLANGVDLEAIRQVLNPYLQNQVARVMEIGPGLGRVIKWLRLNYAQSEVIAVEQSSANAIYLSSILASDSRVSIIHENVVDIALPQTVDVALWMWSGFAEIAPREKQSALQNIKTNLSPNGILVIDLPKEIKGKEVLATSANGLIDLIEPFGTLRAHLLSENQFIEMIGAVGFERVHKLSYRTDTGILRTSHILKSK